LQPANLNVKVKETSVRIKMQIPIFDLVVEAFILLRNTFFDDNGEPIPFALREKRNTQDDPLDEYIANVLTQGLIDAVCQKSPGPLISPDLTIYRPDLCNGVAREVLKVDTNRIVHREFLAYRKASDVQSNWSVEILDDPFPQPKRRVKTTQSRGKFILPIRPRQG
jgi:hypothetical protein